MCRPDWDEYFLDIVNIVKRRSTCLRRKVGAIAVKCNRIISTGYNGPHTGAPHCVEKGGCLRKQKNIASGEKHEICRGIHAEENVIIQAALYNVSIAHADWYVTHQPCSICLRKILNCKPKSLIYLQNYPDDMAEKMLCENTSSCGLITMGNYKSVTQWKFYEN